MLAFFVAAVMLGLYVLHQTPTTELFTVTQAIGEPVPQTGVVPAGMYECAGPKPLTEAPYAVTEDAKLFAFDNNRKSADCCPSPFVSDMGCICLTAEQTAQFASRGGNGNV